MKREIFLDVLQACLLAYDGINEAELIQVYQLNPKIARAGFQLCSYLKSKRLGSELDG